MVVRVVASMVNMKHIANGWKCSDRINGIPDSGGDSSVIGPVA